MPRQWVPSRPTAARPPGPLLLAGTTAQDDELSDEVLGNKRPCKARVQPPSKPGDSQTSQRAEVVSFTNWDWLLPSLAMKNEGPTGHFLFCVQDGPLAFDDSDLTELGDLNGRQLSPSPPNCQGKTQKAKAKHD